MKAAQNETWNSQPLQRWMVRHRHHLNLTCIISLRLLHFEENDTLEEGPGPLT